MKEYTTTNVRAENQPGGLRNVETTSPTMASASHCLPAPLMVCTAPDADKRFDKFQETCELWFNGPLADLYEERKINYFLLWTGDEACALVKTWKLSEEAKKNLQSYWDGFQKFVKPRSNYHTARCNLRSCRQGANETIDQFIRRIQTLVQECSYGAEHEETHTVDELIFGVNSPKVQLRLIQEDQAITLDKALTIARTIEIMRDHMSALKKSQHVDSSIHTVRSSTKQRGHGAMHQRQKNRPIVVHKNGSKSQPTMNTCQRCSSQRCDSRNCPAIQFDCRKCGINTVTLKRYAGHVMQGSSDHKSIIPGHTCMKCMQRSKTRTMRTFISRLCTSTLYTVIMTRSKRLKSLICLTITAANR